MPGPIQHRSIGKERSPVLDDQLSYHVGPGDKILQPALRTGHRRDERANHHYGLSEKREGLTGINELIITVALPPSGIGAFVLSHVADRLSDSSQMRRTPGTAGTRPSSPLIFCSVIDHLSLSRSGHYTNKITTVDQGDGRAGLVHSGMYQ